MTLWAALRDVAAEHVAGIERLADAYLGDRDGLEPVSRARARSAPQAPATSSCSTSARSVEYGAGHIPGARSVPVE